jgi:hypothetical protein
VLIGWESAVFASSGSLGIVSSGSAVLLVLRIGHCFSDG